MPTKLNREIVLLLFTITLFVCTAFAGQTSSDNVWQQVDRTELQQRGMNELPLPAAFETFSLDKAALRSILHRAPEEFTSGQAVILTLPMPDGTFERFEIEHSLVVEPGLLEKYPELGATYRAHGIDDPTAYVRFDLLPNGFHSMILSARGT